MKAHMAHETLTPVADDIEYFAAHDASSQRPLDPAIKARIVVERAVVRHAANALLAAGYRLRLHDGEDWATAMTSHISDVMREIGACDEESLYVWHPSTEPGKEGRPAGRLFLVYGNDGWDVIADHSVALEEVLKSTSDYAETLSAIS